MDMAYPMYQAIYLADRLYPPCKKFYNITYLQVQIGLNNAIALYSIKKKKIML